MRIGLPLITFWSQWTWWSKCRSKQADFKNLRYTCIKWTLGFIERMLLGIEVCTRRKCGVGERGSAVKAERMIHCSQQLSECACSHTLSLCLYLPLSLALLCIGTPASFSLAPPWQPASTTWCLNGRQRPHWCPSHSASLSSTKTAEENKREKEGWKWQPWRCSIQVDTVKHTKMP